MNAVPLPPAYRHWQDAARGLLAPLAALMAPGRADLPIAGAPSDHDAQADRLESFARPLVLAAFWLQSVPRPEDAALREKIAAWFRAGLALGTDPASPQHWGPDASYHQHHVEMGLMAIALQLAPRDLWDPLPAGTRAQVLRWFATCRGGGIVNNNHLFMSVHILEFLRTQGAAHRTDAAVVTAHLNQLETMHRGGGWFEDGINQAFDHYNAYAFHFYGLMWAHLHGAADAKRAQRWRDWARLFVADYAHFFAASGEHPAFGRSITYRFNGLNVFGLALAENYTDLAPGMLRRLCTRNLDFFLSRPIYTEQGALAPGFTDVFPKIIEAYSAPASPYWAAKGFTPLLLPPEHPFWTDPEQPLPAERGFVRVMSAPGLVTRSTPDGEVEILNAGSMVGNTQLRYGAWKWSKLSYRTGVHFTYAFPEISNVPFDSALTQQLDDGRVFGRHSTVAVELADDHLGYTWNMGFKTGQVNTGVETFVFWRAGWLLHVHRYEARQPVVLRLGGFALPLVEPALRAGLNPTATTGSTLAFFSPDDRGTVLQLLAGDAAPDWDHRLDDTTERRHVAAPYHVTPVFTTPRHTGPGVLAALSWTGRDHAEAAPWAIVAAAAGEWTLAHPKLGEWVVRHWSLRLSPDMRSRCRFFLLWALWGLYALWGPWAQAATDPAAVVPAAAPRTGVLAGRHEAFRSYCTTGEGAAAFAKLKTDLDRDWLAWPLPADPLTYGDPAPARRDSAKADKWRAVQDLCGRATGVAEAATLCWLVTGEDKYLAKAKKLLLGLAGWRFAPDWKSGDVPGATDIYYNDEAHFRLWRKLPLIYDQLRAQLTPAEKQTILAHLRERGERSARWIEEEGSITQITRNSNAADLSSHPVRFMPMTGLAGLALWDDLPEARAWWAYAYKFYRDQFPPFGGDDGGWAEGNAYWRGTFEHAAFQDALLAIGDPLAYADPFWKNSPLFALYHVQPYLHTTFGDTSNAGRFNLEPVVADYLEHLARVQQNGFLRSYAALCSDQRTRPVDKGLEKLNRIYPTAAEFLVRNFLASAKPLPAARPLSDLPAQRHFADIGWVSLHSALGQPADDIHITFKSSPHGSFSHSHADQNAFILNAYGESLAINSAYREFHNSPHHREWTRQTISKNALLIDGLGQKAQSKAATGKITRFETGDRYVLATGDATAAYATLQPKGRVKRVTRDLVFIDKRYVVLRDRVELTTPGKLSWLLHSAKPIGWLGDNRAILDGDLGRAALQLKLLSPGVEWQAQVKNDFPVPVDARYVSGEVGGDYVTGKWSDHSHLTLESAQPAASFTVYAVLYPYRTLGPNGARTSVAFVDATLTPDGDLALTHAGTSIRLTLTDDSIQVR